MFDVKSLIQKKVKKIRAELKVKSEKENSNFSQESVNKENVGKIKDKNLTQN